MFVAEQQTLFGMRMMMGDEATADLLFEVADPASAESMAFGRRHSNQMSSLIDAKFKPDGDREKRGDST